VRSAPRPQAAQSSQAEMILTIAAAAVGLVAVVSSVYLAFLL
jgi:hypothetical protein